MTGASLRPLLSARRAENIEKPEGERAAEIARQSMEKDPELTRGCHTCGGLDHGPDYGHNICPLHRVWAC